mgnify:CR=1 FL=1
MLHNAPIRTKLIASLLGPLLVLAVVGLVGIRQNQAESDRAARSTAFARLAAGLAPLIHELQAERSLSTSYVDSDRRQWGGRLAEQDAGQHGLRHVLLARAVHGRRDPDIDQPGQNGD